MRKATSGWYALRWRIFSRDNFTCQYCGRKAPDVILSLDHKNPAANGGLDNEDNLTTACSACNTGKNITLITPQDLSQEKASRSNIGIAVVDFLSHQGKATATDMSKHLGYHRIGITKFLNHCEKVGKIKEGKDKRNTFYYLV